MRDAFDLTDDQRMIRDLARKIARERIAPHAARYDETESYPDESMRAIVESAATQTVDRVGRALGATPLATDPSHTQAVADLLVYLRQSHAERDLAALGRLVAARAGD